MRHPQSHYALKPRKFIVRSRALIKIARFDRMTKSLSQPIDALRQSDADKNSYIIMICIKSRIARIGYVEEVVVIMQIALNAANETQPMNYLRFFVKVTRAWISSFRAKLIALTQLVYIRLSIYIYTYTYTLVYIRGYQYIYNAHPSLYLQARLE